MLNQSLITIILTTFNRAHLIEETLNSIISQTYSNWRCFIIDDNSTDNTNVIVEQYVKNDTRFHFFIKDVRYPKGLSASRNMGMDLIDDTDFIQFFDDDDIMHPQKLELQVLEFKKYKSLDITIFPTTNFKILNDIEIKEVDKKVDSVLINIAEDFILGRRLFTAQVPLIRYNFIKEARFDQTLFYAEEWEVFNKLFFSKNTIASFINVSLFFHRKHDLSITSNFFGKSNIRDVSNNQAFISVYNDIKQSSKFDGKIFCRFITFALNYKEDKLLLNTIKKDLKNKLFPSKIKNQLLLFMIPFVSFNKKNVTRLIHRIARW